MVEPRSGSAIMLWQTETDSFLVFIRLWACAPVCSHLDLTKRRRHVNFQLCHISKVTLFMYGLVLGDDDDDYDGEW